jgi:hypothetical protein
VTCPRSSVGGSIPTVVKQTFQLALPRIHTQSSITNIIFTWVHNTNTHA